MSAPEPIDLNPEPRGSRSTFLAGVSADCARASGVLPLSDTGRYTLGMAAGVFAALAAELAVIERAGAANPWPGVVGPHPDPAWRGVHADAVAEAVGLDHGVPLDVLHDELRSVGRLREMAREARATIDELSAFRHDVASMVGVSPCTAASDQEILDALRWRDDLMTTRLREERERAEARRVHLALVVAAVEPVLDGWQQEERPHRGIGTELADALDRLASAYAALPNPPAAPDEGVTDGGPESEATPG